jgi:hypothetical protein
MMCVCLLHVNVYLYHFLYIIYLGKAGGMKRAEALGRTFLDIQNICSESLTMSDIRSIGMKILGMCLCL